MDGREGDASRPREGRPPEEGREAGVTDTPASPAEESTRSPVREAVVKEDWGRLPGEEPGEPEGPPD